jgi:hypothetical protein
MLRGNYLHREKAQLLRQLWRKRERASIHLYRRKIQTASFAKFRRPIVKKMPTLFVRTTPNQLPAALFAMHRRSWPFITEAIDHARYVIVLGFKVVAAPLVNAEYVSHFNDSLDKRSLPAHSRTWNTRTGGFSALLRFAMHTVYGGTAIFSMGTRIAIRFAAYDGAA